MDSLYAKSVSIDEEDKIVFISFNLSSTDDIEYFHLSCNLDEKYDRKQGYYSEWNEQIKGSYLAIERVTLTHDFVKFYFNEKGKQIYGCDLINIRFTLSSQEVRYLQLMLLQIFNETTTIVQFVNEW